MDRTTSSKMSTNRGLATSSLAGRHSYYTLSSMSHEREDKEWCKAKKVYIAQKGNVPKRVPLFEIKKAFNLLVSLGKFFLPPASSQMLVLDPYQHFSLEGGEIWVRSGTLTFC